MLTNGTDALYRTSLGRPHEPYSRLDVYSGAGVLLASNIKFFSGSVRGTLSSRVTRDLEFTVHESMYPLLATDLLAPYGNVVRAYHGIRLGDGSTKYVWQVFGGRIQEVTLDERGTVSVHCADFAQDVIDHGFLAPQSASVGLLATDQVKLLISDGYPGAQFGYFYPYAQVMLNLTWDADRGDALDQISRGLGAFWYSLASEEFTLRPIPWTVAGTPVVTLSDDDGGIVTGYRVNRSRSGVYNLIVATSERLDGSAPAYATSPDDNPASPTYVGGQFGIRTRQVRTQNLNTQGAAQSLADDYLRSSKALTESWDVSIMADASLELGDVVNLDVAGRTGVVQVIESFSLPLGGTTMGLGLRSLVPGLLEE